MNKIITEVKLAAYEACAEDIITKEDLDGILAVCESVDVSSGNYSQLFKIVEYLTESTMTVTTYNPKHGKR